MSGRALRRLKIAGAFAIVYTAPCSRALEIMLAFRP